MKEIKIAFIIIAGIIGAGFASGKEIFEYFAKYGIFSLLYLLPLFACIYIFTKTLLNYGANITNNSNFENTLTLNKSICLFKRKISPISAFMLCTFLILSSAMFSGLISLFETYFPFANMHIVFLLVLMFSCLIIKMPFRAISKVSYVLVPAIIILIIFCAIFTFKGANFTTNLGEENILPLALKTPLYASGNLFVASFMIINFGKMLNKKEQTKVSLYVAIILCLLLVLGILCFMFNPRIAFSDMPFAEISLQISPLFSIIFGVIIFFAIITTYATTTSSLKVYFNGRKKYNNHFIMLVIIALLSLIDFGTIVELLYPVIGVFGIYYLLCLAKANNKLMNNEY